MLAGALRERVEVAIAAPAGGAGGVAAVAAGTRTSETARTSSSARRVMPVTYPARAV